MRSAKPYTNATFTKRVDHDGGRHRPERAAKEPAACPGCGAIYAKRRWTKAPAARVATAAPPRPLTVRLCPACRRRDSGVPRGFLHVDGDFFTAHRGEIERLLRNEVDRARVDNPLQQILAWSELDGDGLIVATSTEHLAQRLGRALESAFHGAVRYGFSHENKLAHVWWHR